MHRLARLLPFSPMCALWGLPYPFQVMHKAYPAQALIVKEFIPHLGEWGESCFPRGNLVPRSSVL